MLLFTICVNTDTHAHMILMYYVIYDEDQKTKSHVQELTVKGLYTNYCDAISHSFTNIWMKFDIPALD